MMNLRTYCLIILFCAATVIASPAQSVFFMSLLSFDYTNGANPASSLTQYSDRNFYGTTDWGVLLRIKQSSALGSGSWGIAAARMPHSWSPSKKSLYWQLLNFMEARRVLQSKVPVTT